MSRYTVLARPMRGVHLRHLALATVVFTMHAEAASPADTVVSSSTRAHTMLSGKEKSQLRAVAVPARATETLFVTGRAVAPEVRRFALPQTTAGIDRHQIESTINIVDTEDALKYLPGLFLRKRNNGDTQATLQTRTWGVNSSARSLVYVDDASISALISNNNTNGAPRWGMVAPEQIERVDMLYGPFAAEYPGNSMGGVVLITTRIPDHYTATIKQTGSVQSYGAYKTRGNYGTSNSAVTIGDRNGRFSWLFSANREESLSV
ncbi:TonB-dependent receptor plug domain-containing protein [Acetobacter fallax]|uniref:TonB-dependent receptor plug domain-containing protein n=1 Tax=Acetobacter fallax TaxID=1737473 RepID=UPI001F54D8CB|nr:Plug domain-containing protein [Acetobacter fallax]